MVDNSTNATTFSDWSVPKVIATQVPEDWDRHEYSTLAVRGTGLNNHHASYIKIDDNVLLDHAFYIGLYLAIIDRRDLSLAFSEFYDTSRLPQSAELIDGFEKF